MIRYIDFEPEFVGEARFLRDRARESMKSVLARINDWQASHGYKVYNVETIALQPVDTVGISVVGSGEMVRTQVIRVWYDDGL